MAEQQTQSADRSGVSAVEAAAVACAKKAVGQAKEAILDAEAHLVSVAMKDESSLKAIWIKFGWITIPIVLVETMLLISKHHL